MHVYKALESMVGCSFAFLWMMQAYTALLHCVLLLLACFLSVALYGLEIMLCI